MIRMRLVVAAPAVFLLSALLFTGFAVAAEWRILKMSGDVRIFHDNVTWVSLKRGQELKPGDAIWTGHNGRVMLSFEDGRVLLKPRSLVKIPKKLMPNGRTVLFHSMGTVDADIDKQDHRHFSIQSPFMAAVVKGTSFSIEISKKQTRLSVREGLVEAIDTKSGQSVSVAAGQYVVTVNGVSSGFGGNAPGAETPEAADGSPSNSNGSGGSSGRSGSRGGGGADDSSAGNNGNNGNQYGKNGNNGRMLGRFK